MARTPPVELSPKVADEIKATTCYMCACRCGILVHLQDGQVRYIRGNPRHPVNRGVLCAKGSAGIMNHLSPARLSKPLKRVGPRGEGRFREIEWSEAMALATARLARIRATDPRRLAFFTGRDQSQALTGWWARQFGTPNHAAHGGFCSVNMAAAGLYSIGGSFWEFGEPDWERCRYFMMFGVAEDHDSNPIKMGLSKIKGRGAKFVSVNPIRTGYSAIADEWLGVRPGTDGLLILALVHCLLEADRIDLDFMVRYTDAAWLVIDDPGGPEDGLFARDPDGAPLAWSADDGRPVDARTAGLRPALIGPFVLPDGRAAETVFQRLAGRYLKSDYAPEAVADRVGIAAATIRRIAGELAAAAFDDELVLEIPWTDWAGRHHERIIGRPVAIHAMRGISAHSNGFQTCRALHLLQMLLGSIDAPGGFLYKSPYPKAIPPSSKPAGRPGEVVADQPMPGPPLGFPAGPEDLLIEDDGTAGRIDKAFSWEAPLGIHGLLHLVIPNAAAGDPYPIDTLFLYMANMSWNSSMNTAGAMEMLTRPAPNAESDADSGAHENDDDAYAIPFVIYSDAFASEMVAYADLVLPDTTYLERWDCISLLDRPIGSAEGPGDSIRQPVVSPDRDVRPFQDVLLDLGARLGLPGMVDAEGAPLYPGGYPDYMVNHEREPGIGPLAGWRGDGDVHGRGPVNPKQLDAYIAHDCFWHHELAPAQRYLRHGNLDYLKWAQSMGFVGKADQIILHFYSEPVQRFRLAAEGHGPVQPPEGRRRRIIDTFDPLAIWYPPFEGEQVEKGAFPLYALTQRPMAMYHSWGSQNPWLRQIHGENPLYIHHQTAAAHGIADDDWVWVSSHHGRIKARARLMDGVNPDTVWTWNGIGKRAGAWGLAADAPEAARGFLLNHLISELLPEKSDGMRYANTDPITGQAAWFDLRVKIEKADGARAEAGRTAPQFAPLHPPPGQPPKPAVLRFGKQFSARKSS